MFTLVVTNRKGGTAKTTTAVNLAAEFAQQGKRCLVIDLDPQGHTGLGLGFQSEDKNHQAQSILVNARQSVNQLIRQTDITNLSFISSTTLTENDAIKINRLENFLNRKQLVEKFDITVIDTPPNAGPEQQAAINCADGIIIPFMPSPLGKAGVQQILQDIKSKTARPNKSNANYALVPIMVDSRIKLDNRIVSEMVSEYGIEKMLRGIRRNVRLAEAFDAGQPVNLYDAHSRGAFDYHMLAEDISSIWPKLYAGKASLVEKANLSIISDQTIRSRIKIKPNTHNSHRGIRLKSSCHQWNN